MCAACKLKLQRHMKLKGKSVMKVESIRTLNGPNVYSYRPVVLMRLDLGELVERESREFDGFNDKLLTLLPGIHNHHCSLGRPAVELAQDKDETKDRLERNGIPVPKG